MDRMNTTASHSQFEIFGEEFFDLLHYHISSSHRYKKDLSIFRSEVMKALCLLINSQFHSQRMRQSYFTILDILNT